MSWMGRFLTVSLKNCDGDSYFTLPPNVPDLRWTSAKRTNLTPAKIDITRCLAIYAGMTRQLRDHMTHTLACLNLMHVVAAISLRRALLQHDLRFAAAR